MGSSMDSARQTVHTAIDRSIHRDMIVSLPWTPEVASYLTYLADDDARAWGVVLRAMDDAAAQAGEED